MNLLINFLNPEITKLYNFDVNSLDGWKRKHISELTKICYILTASSVRRKENVGFDGKIIIPVTYFGEIEWINDYLVEIEPLIDQKIVCYTSSVPNIEERIELKKKEYRDNPVILGRYKKFNYSLVNKIIYQPKVIYSARAVITEKWKKSVEMEDDFWINIIRRTGKYHFDVMEDTLYRIPELLDGKALIYEFIKPVIPVEIDKREQAILELRLSEYYLMSFFYEYDCRIITNTKFGMLDCSGIYPKRCTISYDYFYKSLVNLNLQFLLDLSWTELTRRINRYFSEFQVIMDFIVNEYDNPSTITSLKWNAVSNIVNKKKFFGDDGIRHAADGIRRILMDSNFSEKGQIMIKKNTLFQLIGVNAKLEDHSTNTIADSNNSNKIIISMDQKEKAAVKLSVLDSLIEMDTNAPIEDTRIAKAGINTLKKELEKPEPSKKHIEAALETMKNITTIVGFGKIIGELIAILI